jgi:EAL domain-containing protein (putative c-di-GMP-specific phosphodiesterase class I)/GGDEF domain-containing protein/uncharacterized membrane protein HdeD (DUF308 family)
LERTCLRTPSLASKLQQEPRFGGVFFESVTVARQVLSPNQADSHCMPRKDPDLGRRFLGCPPETCTMLRQPLIHFDTRLIFSSLLKCQKFDAKRSGGNVVKNTAETIRAEASALLDQLTDIDTSSAEMPRRMINLVARLTGSVLVVLGLNNLVAPTEQGVSAPIQTGVAVIFGGLLHLVFARYCKTAKVLHPLLGLWLTIALASLYLVAVAVNGLKPTILLPTLLIYIYVLTSTRTALFLSIAATGSSILLLIMHGVVWAIITRTSSAAFLIIFFMHLLKTYVSEITRSAFSVTNGMTQLVQRLDSDLADSFAERDRILTTDSQTGLLNRIGFVERLAIMFASPQHTARPFFLITFRLKGFQRAIARLDQSMRDHVINTLARRLEALVGSQGAIGRTAENIFVLFVPFAQDHDENGRQAVAGQVLQTLRQPFTSGGVNLAFETNLGFVTGEGGSADVAAVMEQAGIALSYAVSSAASAPVFHSPEIATKVTQAVELSDEFRGALADGQFVLHYQPIINLADGGLCKAEALIRWNHPQKGLLYPRDFIAIAEERGHLIVMTKWVLAEAARQVRQWRKAFDPGFQVSVNIPPLFLKACLEQGENLVACMEELNISPGSLILEITENAFLTIDDTMLELLSKLQSLGFLHAIDDFGVGYSSLGQFDKLSLDILKIDKSLVDSIASSRKSQAIYDAVIRMCHRLRVDVVAEGVEDTRQLSLLIEAGCRYGQGYLFAKPLPNAEFDRFYMSLASGVRYEWQEIIRNSKPYPPRPDSASVFALAAQ